MRRQAHDAQAQLLSTARNHLRRVTVSDDKRALVPYVDAERPGHQRAESSGIVSAGDTDRLHLGAEALRQGARCWQGPQREL